jgi:dTDP-4-dehydrorhamnose 3,5-epimerase
MHPPGRIPIKDCEMAPVSANRDERGCLFEIYRRSWPGAFPTVQWNACASQAGVMRGVHVHVDYHEFYTLPRGRVILGLADIRRESPSFGVTHQIELSSVDGVAVVVPIGVAHAVYFLEDSVLVIGLSDYWSVERDVVGCRWDDPALGFSWPCRDPARSRRDRSSGGYAEMIADYERLSRAHRSECAA